MLRFAGGRFPGDPALIEPDDGLSISVNTAADETTASSLQMLASWGEPVPAT